MITILSGCNNINFSNTNEITENLEACAILPQTDQSNIIINSDGCPELVNENNKNTETEQEIKKTTNTANEQMFPINIATCTTFQKFFEHYDFNLVKTNSTSQSFDLLANGDVDYIIGGRTAKSGEEYKEYKILGSGYSFLHKQSISISNKELQMQIFYTDLDDIDNIKKIFQIRNLEKVENIYNYINNDLVITSRENTDYTKGDIVHVLHPNGERYIQSRIPILYCKNKCENHVIENIKKNLTIN